MSSGRGRLPGGVVELLRLCVIVFFAGLGYEIASAVQPDPRPVLGPFDTVGVGLILGSAFGYVLGGALGRTTLGAVRRTEASLGGVDAENLVAGGFGAVVGVVLGAGLTWPLFLVNRPWVTVPVFGFIVVTTALLGYRVGSGRKEAMLGMFGARAGLPARGPGTSALPRLVDTSVAIDGRIVDVVRAGFLHGQMLVPRPVLDELQGLADAADDVRRARGRRGLEVLETLRREPGVELVVTDDQAPGVAEVDAKLIRIGLDTSSALLTLDTNLARAAALAGVRVLNLHALALALRPPVGAGDEVDLLLTKPGREPGQAVGYLDDGTMVVVERARDRVGSEARVTVTSVLTTANGRMVFARLAAAPIPTPQPHRQP